MINRQESETSEAFDVGQLEVLALTPLYFWLKFKREETGEETTPSAIADFLVKHPRKNQISLTLSDDRIAQACNILDETYAEGVKKNGRTLEERVANAALTALAISGEKLEVPLLYVSKGLQEKERILREIVSYIDSDQRFLLRELDF